MQDNGHHDVPYDSGTFNRNRNSLPPEATDPYINRWVAWRGDGLCILAAGADIDEVERKVLAMGLDPRHVVYSFVPDPDVSYL